jgi:putative membrane protein
MLWLKAFHLIFVITWFCGLFYLPRLFVYHAMSEDEISRARFVIMERKLYFGIALPSAILATLLGIVLLHEKWIAVYSHTIWMPIKLILVVFLWLYTLYLAKLWLDFKRGKARHSHTFYRWVNEFPTVLLLAIVILTIVKPF